LQLRFTRTGERTIECRFTGSEHQAGAPGVLHGGVQAALLDEALGVAVRTGVEDEERVVTAEFQLRYRRPVPLGEEVVVRGELVRVDGRDFHVEGRIESRTGELLTGARARWRSLDVPPR
jgi:uncharacterized protein (TIGR00369 family)